MEKLLIIAENVIFFSEPDPQNAEIRAAKKDDEFFISRVGKKDGEYWLKAKIDDSFEGYIKADNSVAVILPVKLKQKECPVYQEPTSDSTQISVLKRKTKISLIHKTNGKDKQSRIWDKIRMESGEIGYIPSETNVIPVNQAENSRRKVCLTIVIFLCIMSTIGYANIFLTNAQAETDIGGLLLLLLGVLISGAFTYFILEGISRLFKSKTEKYYYPDLYAIYENQIV
jgi:hypothetical protein